jgi:hypothetical protein
VEGKLLCACGIGKQKPLLKEDQMAVLLQEQDYRMFSGEVLEGESGFQEQSDELSAEDIDGKYYDEFLWDLTCYAKNCIDKFFAGKEMYGGGPVPARLLCSPRYVSMVINTDVMTGVPCAYKAMKRAEHPLVQQRSQLTSVPKDVKLVISILNHCKQLEIPKQFACGLMLMYLEICEGVQVLD